MIEAGCEILCLQFIKDINSLLTKSGLKFQLGSPHHIFGPDLWTSKSVVVSGLVAVVNELVAGFSVLVARISGQVAEVSRLGVRVRRLMVGVR